MKYIGKMKNLFSELIIKGSPNECDNGPLYSRYQKANFLSKEKGSLLSTTNSALTRGLTGPLYSWPLVSWALRYHVRFPLSAV